MKSAARYLIPAGISLMAWSGPFWFIPPSAPLWLSSLNLPATVPGPLAAAIIWSVCGLLCGLAYAWTSLRFNNRALVLTVVFGLMLLFAVSSNIAFFNLQNPLLALCNLIILEFLIIYFQYHAFYIMAASSYILLPCAIWVAYAIYANIFVILLN